MSNYSKEKRIDELLSNRAVLHEIREEMKANYKSIPNYMEVFYELSRFAMIAYYSQIKESNPANEYTIDCKHVESLFNYTWQTYEHKCNESLEMSYEILSIFLIYLYCEIQSGILNNSFPDIEESLKTQIDDSKALFLNLTSGLILSFFDISEKQLSDFLVKANSNPDNPFHNTRITYSSKVFSDFMNACGSHDYRTANKLLSKIYRFRKDSIKYYEGYIEYSMRNYPEAINYFSQNMSLPTYSDEYYASKAYLSICYATLGDVDNCLKTINRDDRRPLDKNTIIYLCQLLALNATRFDPSKLVNIIYTDEVTGGKNLLITATRIAFQSMVDGINIVTDIKADGISQRYSFAHLDTNINMLKRCNYIISCIFPDVIFFNIPDDPDQIISSNPINALQNKAVMLINEALDYEDKYSLSNIVLLNYIYKMELYVTFHAIATGMYKDLLKLPDTDEYSEFLYNAYIAGLYIDHPDEVFMDYYAKNLMPESIVPPHFFKKLSSKSRKLYESAEWLYSNTKIVENDGSTDAGMIAFAYFRIVENVLDDKLIAKLYASINPDELRQLYEESKITYGQPLIQNWDLIVNKFTNNSNSDDSDFTLGQISRLFKNISNSQTTDDPVADYIKDKISALLTREGQSLLFENNYMFMSLSQENIERFRNSSAHCHFISYETACECRDFTNSFLATFTDCLID